MTIGHIYAALSVYGIIIIAGVLCAGLITAFAWGFLLGLSQAEIEDDETG